MKKDKRLKINFFMVLMAFSVIPLVLSIAIVSYVSITYIKNNLESSAKQTLFIAANNLASHCKENNISFATSDNYNDYLDSLQEQNIEMAIILDGYPCVTSIKNETGYRVREIEFEKDMQKDAAELMEGYYDGSVIINEQVYFGYYMPITKDDKIIGMAFAGELQQNVNGSIQKIVFSFASLSVIMVVIFFILAIVFSKYFMKSFSTINHSVIALSQGDLSKQKTRTSAVKEMSHLLSATTQMQVSLSEIMGKIQDILQNLVSRVEEVTGLSENSAGRAESITCATEELSASTLKMSEHVQDINTQMIEIGSCVNDIFDSVEHLSMSTDCILQVNAEATENMDVVLTNSKTSVSAVNNIADQIRETNEAIQKIDMAVELILSISEQSGLLSLNAAIEAARAGEAGKGFAVVADEIGKLAQQSSDGAEAIRNLAKVITEQSEKSVELAEDIQRLMLEEQEDISRSKLKFEELSSNINLSVEQIKTIANKTENLTENKEKVIVNVHDLSAISEENAAENQEVNANIEEIMNGIQMVNQNCDILNQFAQELEQAISFFHN